MIDMVHEVQANSGAAEATFWAVEGAFNRVLPGSHSHPRYSRIDEVGLALVIGADGVEPDSYNPLDPSTLGRLAFAIDNQAEHPKAWVPLEADPEILGGPMPATLGRFSVFALAKANTLTINTAASSSFRVEGVSVGPGQVGFAGGNRFEHSLLAMSGLWEIHDHVAGKIYATELARLTNTEAEQKSAEELSEVVDDIIAQITAVYGYGADKLLRTDLEELLTETDIILDRTLA